MTGYIVFDSTGKILRTGGCQRGILELQAGPGEYVIAGKADDIRDRIAGGVVVRKTAKEILAAEEELRGRKDGHGAI